MTFKGTVIFNGTVLSGFVTKYGFSEARREILGPNESTARSGSGIDDTRAIKFDPTYTLIPLTPAQMKIIWGLASLKGYRTLKYTDATGELQSVQARMHVQGGAQLVMDTSERTLYDGIVLNFEVK